MKRTHRKIRGNEEQGNKLRSQKLTRWSSRWTVRGKLIHTFSFSSFIPFLLSEETPTLLLCVFNSWLFFIFPPRFLTISCSEMLIRQTLKFSDDDVWNDLMPKTWDFSPNPSCDQWLWILAIRMKMTMWGNLFWVLGIWKTSLRPPFHKPLGLVLYSTRSCFYVLSSKLGKVL